MPKREPSEYAVHLMLSGGHREVASFKTLAEFQAWYQNKLSPKAKSTDEFLTVPMKNSKEEFMAVRPAHVLAIRVEAIYKSSVDRF